MPELLRWARKQHLHAKKGGAMVCVAPGLFLGNKQAAADRALLRSHGVVAVCPVGARQVFNDDLVYHRVSVEDDGSESMLPHFAVACDFIHTHRARGAVLVHCKGGISRSPTMVVAYLMRHERLPMLDAMEVCSIARPAASPRQIFLKDLAWFQDQLFAAVEERGWEQALALAQADDAVDALAALTPREVCGVEDVQAECRRLLVALQHRCIREAFGDTRDASAELEEAAKAAVARYAKAQGWTRRPRRCEGG